MEQNLLRLPANKLLHKFGAGDHKPGSGSAAAFHGLLSANLLITVILLTNEKKRQKKYASVLPRLLKIQDEIQSKILPDLEHIFQEDSVQFGKTISLRKQRDATTDAIDYGRLAQKALDELKIAIDLPIAIAKHSVTLAKMAAFVFDKGFQSARGDTQVALSGAVAAIGGCLSIVRLNLLHYHSDEYAWTENVRQEVGRLTSSFEELKLVELSKIKILQAELNEKASFHKDVADLLVSAKNNKQLSDAAIENYVVRLQLLVWKHREEIWKSNPTVEPRHILQPSIVFKSVLGYSFFAQDNLGLVSDHDIASEIAGLIDQEIKIVKISTNFSK